jgi:hypothetical protein
MVPKEWVLPIIFTCYGIVCAVSAVQPWLRRTRSFWVSLAIAGIVQLFVGHIINARLAPQSRGELKGSAFLAILAGYAVAIPLFLLLQSTKPKSAPESKSP